MSIETFKEWIRAALRKLLGPPLSLGVRLVYGRAENTAAPRTERPSTQHSPPIDIVYTWVDDADPDWRKKFDHYRSPDSRQAERSHTTRYHNRQELRYSLRSVACYAPFVHTIYIVTDDQVPDWLNTAHPRVRIVSHKDIFTSAELLPTFNSHAIEANLHRIPDLAEHYVYMNDDVFFGQPITPSDFFTSDNRTISYLSPHRAPPSASGRKKSTLDLAYVNNQKLIESAFNRTIEFKLAHAPHSQLRSVLYEMEDRFRREFTETSGHRFRDSDDISVASCLFQYYAYYSARGVMRKPDESARLAYINVASPLLAPFLRKILITKQYKFLCINEPISAIVDTGRFDDLVIDFLGEYYPTESEFELAS